MMKISALNEESSEESDEENVPAITKEAEEQIALTEYNKALELLTEQKTDEALLLLKDLLETELLDQVEKPEIPDGRANPMLSLKYCCYKNIASIYSKQENYDEAIDNYWEAANLDDTDVMLWCRMGKLAMKKSNLEFAATSFKQGLKCNENHWPCLDSIITVMFAVPDYMNCLLYISMALERDPTYVKGLAFREKIFKDIPYFEESYKLFNPDWTLDPPVNVEYDRLLGEKLISEAQEIADKWVDYCKPQFEQQALPELLLNKSVTNYSWLDLGQSLVDMHEYMTDNNLNFVSKIKIDVGKPGDDKNDDVFDEKPEEKIVENVLESPDDVEMILDEEKNQENQLNDQQVLDVTLENEAMDVDPEEDDEEVTIVENKDPSPTENEVQEEKLEEPSDSLNQDDVPNPPASSDEKPEALDKEKSSEDKQKNEKSNEPSEQKQDEQQQQKVKKRRRSSLCFLQQWAWSSSSQRRSPRVRGSNRREAEREEVQLEETMRRIFPSNLLPDTAKIIRDDPLKSIDDSMDTMDLYQLFANRDTNNSNNEGTKSSESSKPPSPEINEKYFNTDSEKNDVMEFINKYSCKNNLMIIIAKFTECLAIRWNIEWPKELIDIYLQAYLFTREHVPHGSPLDDDVNEEERILKYDAEMTLLFCELHTDKWLDNKPENLPDSLVDKFGTGIPSEELGYILFASVRDDFLNEENATYLFRVLWVKANIFMCQGDAEIAVRTLELLLHDLQEYLSSKISVKLPNCKYFSRFNCKIVEKRLASVERGQKLGEVQKLYDEKRYAELSLILQDTFKFTKQRNEVVTMMKLNVDRIKQLSMLLDCFWQLQQYEDCYVWAETCLNEAWQIYINSTDELEQKKWSQSVKNSLEKLESCVEIAGTMIVKYLPDSRSTRLVQNLIQILCHQLDVPEGTIEMPLETVIPWILLHHILQYEDDKERAKTKISQKIKQTDQSHDSDSDNENDDDKNIPAAIMILFTGHDFLGKHSWCCINEAKLLIFTMKTVIPSISGPRLNDLREKISKYLEQIFWCLYGHPNRFNKTKPKYLDDHVVPQISMTWEIAQLLFEFYKPTIYPEFDTAKGTAISADTKILFKKISTLVPKDNDPSFMVDDMTSYIVGEIDKPPIVKKSLPYQVDSLYYLLGDYSFKNNIWPSAIKYYTMDIILHPDAFNSWVALAMSVSTVIGTSLNNCKPLSDIVKLLHQAKMAQCSYRRAIELKPGHSVIWIEYGNFVYSVHSFCSRLLKQESDTLSMEKFAILETRKEDTLDVAADCFNSANRIYLANVDDEPHMQDERWLHHYMLAKIAEKKNDEPLEFLEHYKTSSELLHQNNAFYPRRISHKNALYLSIEALEVHYRIHASILKYLEQHEGKSLKKSLGQLFLKTLLDCANSQFMQFPSKLMKNKRKEEENVQEKVDKDVVLMDKVETKSKNESKKRQRDNLTEESSKRIKVNEISHLGLVQEVLGLLGDLITKVCDSVDEKEQREGGSSDEIMVISSDESEKERNIVENKNETFETKISSCNAQDIMDDLMKQAMEEAELLLPEDDDDPGKEKWTGEGIFSGKERDGKVDKKKSQINAVKNEASMSRRGSQESTTTTLTTTTNETNNSSFSSSDESSSSDDSSDSDSSSIETDSDSGDSEAEKKKTSTLEEKEEFMSETEVGKIVAYCLAGLEQCVLRFPEHYKSIYRICHYYFNSKTSKDNKKCRDLLLGTYHCQYYTGLTFQGLFADRKNTNFFNGVWRIPVEEIDRPGSFASHMSRCVTLLMQILKETDDSKMLMELCIQLRKTPDPDKKYVRDSEREQLSRQALTLCLQSLRTRLGLMGPPKLTDNSQLFRTDSRTHCLLDVYKTYQQVQKNFQGKEVQAFATLLVDTYKTYMGIKTGEGNLLEIAMRFCQQQNLANKIAASNSSHQHSSNVLPSIITTTITSSAITATTTTVTAPMITSSPSTSSVSVSSAAVNQAQSQSVPTSPQSTQRKAYKNSGTGRPRGRPPNINKHLQNQFNTFGNYLGAAGNQSLLPPYYMMDPNMLSAMIASGFTGNMLDPLNYLTQMGNYGDLLRQYQNLSSLSGFNNLPTSLPSASSIPTTTNSTTSQVNSGLGNLPSHGSLTVQQLLNLKNAASTTTSSSNSSSMMFNQSKPVTTTSSSKDLSHSVSITPVTAPVVKTKTKHMPVHNDQISAHIAKAMHSNPPVKQVSHSPTQVSLLKPSVIQSTKSTGQKQMSTAPKQMSAPTIRVSKSLTEPQPAHNSSSFSMSPLKSGSSSGINLPPSHQNNPLNLQPGSLGMSQSRGTSLQHKLLSKKQGQSLSSQKSTTSSSSSSSSSSQIKKQRSSSKNSIPSLPTSLQSLLNMSGAGAMSSAPFIPSELGGLSVSAVNNHGMRDKLPSSKLSSFRKTSKTKNIDLQKNSGAAPQPSSSEALSMLSQLQQHSHLEIIPQAKSSHKTVVDYSKNVAPSSLSVLPSKSLDGSRTGAPEIPGYEPTRKSSGSSKKGDKHQHDSVEIITLDD